MYNSDWLQSPGVKSLLRISTEDACSRSLTDFRYLLAPWTSKQIESGFNCLLTTPKSWLLASLLYLNFLSKTAPSPVAETSSCVSITSHSNPRTVLWVALFTWQFFVLFLSCSSFLYSSSSSLTSYSCSTEKKKKAQHNCWELCLIQHINWELKPGRWPLRYCTLKVYSEEGREEPGYTEFFFQQKLRSQNIKRLLLRKIDISS